MIFVTARSIRVQVLSPQTILIDKLLNTKCFTSKNLSEKYPLDFCGLICDYKQKPFGLTYYGVTEFITVWIQTRDNVKIEHS